MCASIGAVAASAGAIRRPVPHRKLGSDLGLPKVIEIGYKHGLVESTCLRVDDTWAGLKFTHPKKGKVYNNLYGTLPDA